MKSYILSGITSAANAKAKLQHLLPCADGKVWVLRDESEDPMAYFAVIETGEEEDRRAPFVVADISGRHYNCDERVLAVLTSLREKVGGEFVYSP